MCAIVGFWDAKCSNGELIMAQMAQTLYHRGPDDSGVWADNLSGMTLGHRRLSILDLSTAGHQPMLSPCGRYVLVYNGEIYNHVELRKELDSEGGGFDWRSHSDTETLLAGLCHWSVDHCLKKVNGMFAFAFWDREKKQLILARDRMGEKPLYYGYSNNTFLFGSELKAFKAYPSWQCNINREALALFLQYSYVPSPLSIYEGVFKLPPAHYIVIEERGHKISNPYCY